MGRKKNSKNKKSKEQKEEIKQQVQRETEIIAEHEKQLREEANRIL